MAHFMKKRSYARSARREPRHIILTRFPRKKKWNTRGKNSRAIIDASFPPTLPSSVPSPRRVCPAQQREWSAISPSSRVSRPKPWRLMQVSAAPGSYLARRCFPKLFCVCVLPAPGYVCILLAHMYYTRRERLTCATFYTFVGCSYEVNFARFSKRTWLSTEMFKMFNVLIFLYFKYPITVYTRIFRVSGSYSLIIDLSSVHSCLVAGLTGGRKNYLVHLRGFESSWKRTQLFCVYRPNYGFCNIFNFDIMRPFYNQSIISSFASHHSYH